MKRTQRQLKQGPEWMRQKRAAALRALKTFSMPEDAASVPGEIAPFVTREEEAIISSFEDAYHNPALAAILEGAAFSLIHPTEWFLANHCAHVNRGILVWIPEGKKISAPIHLRTILGETSTFEHIVIVAEAGSAAVIELFVEGGTDATHSQVAEVFTKNGAELTIHSHQEANPSATIFSCQNVLQEGFSRVHWFDSRFGGRWTRAQSFADLKEPGSEYIRRTVYASKTGAYDVVDAINMGASQTTGCLYSNAVLDGDAKASHQGRVHVDRGATGSVCEEQLHTTVLSDQARACPMPVLEIETKEIKAHHKASVGHIDPDQLFYLQSRGFSEHEARQQLVAAGFAPFLSQLPNPESAARVLRAINTSTK